ncbi:GDSL esterase/lipase At1g29670-like [Mangifera indica]|uniref:GDSL esterase/lipase At1g29670-like n=1 Tax=Mangifera indica TaxID=29780 RepID=UPI001CFA3DD9|nr:GDSL esterase/lipase At1g29670-like [Mangifera indica]
MVRRPEMWHLVVLVILQVSAWVYGVPQVPCYFIFGDSLFDNGNNNYLLTKAKANYPPYGTDFPGGPTGRFSNGRNMGDFLAELLGFESYIPSFASSLKGGEDILQGVNYASGGAGIRDETAIQNLGEVISMNKQLLRHQETISHIMRIYRDRKSAEEYLRKCMYTVGIGNNDYINNYFLPEFYPTSHQYTPDQYSIHLVQQYSQQLKDLYELGARKIAVFGLGLIGCTPGSVAMHGTNGSSCVDSMNIAVQLFNAKLSSLVDDLNKQFPDAKFIYVNIFGISSTPAAGSSVSNVPCCEVANLAMTNGVLTCIPYSIICSNRAQYLFWDATHPTEAVSLFLAGRSYSSQLPSDAHPMDISSLAQI